jgi:hypothetical protein
MDRRRLTKPLIQDNQRGFGTPGKLTKSNPYPNQFPLKLNIKPGLIEKKYVEFTATQTVDTNESKKTTFYKISGNRKQVPYSNFRKNKKTLGLLG